MITVYTPAHNPLTFVELDPLLHCNVYGAVPPEGATVIVPLHCPQDVEIIFLEIAIADGCVIVTFVVAPHPEASVTTT
jgi:hypothetical protein